MRYLFFLFFLLILSCQKEKTVYDITFVDLQGNKVKIERPEDKKLLLYVWTGTCTGHTEDMKLINKHYEKLSKKYEIVSLAVFMTPQDIKKVLNQYGIKPKFKVLADPQGNLTDLVKLVFLPSTMIFNEDGKLLKNYPRFPLRDLVSPVKPHYVGLCQNFAFHFAFHFPPG